jgi:hypothetical protein
MFQRILQYELIDSGGPASTARVWGEASLLTELEHS